MRMAFGVRDTDALIALAMLALGGTRPPQQNHMITRTDGSGESEFS